MKIRMDGHCDKTLLLQKTLWNNCSHKIFTAMSITNTLTRKEMHKTKATSRTIQKLLLQFINYMRWEFIKKGNYVVILCGLCIWVGTMHLPFVKSSSNSLPFKSLSSLAPCLYILLNSCSEFLLIFSTVVISHFNSLCHATHLELSSVVCTCQLP